MPCHTTRLPWRRLARSWGAIRRRGLGLRAWMLGVGALVAGLALGSLAEAADRVRTAKGTVNGTIRSISPAEVTIELAGGESQTIRASDIRSLGFDGEPNKLQSVRAAATGGRYDDALRALDEIDAAAITRAEIKTDLDFYRAWCQGKLALAGAGNPREAGKQVRDFVRANPQSHHFYPASELLGDLLAAVGAYDKALEEYAKIEGSGWPDARLRAGVARGRVLRTQGRGAEALAAFDAVLAEAGDGADEALVAQRLAAQLGKAECLADAGQYDEGVKLVQEIIRQAAPEDTETRARAYNALGVCWKKAGRPKDALLAYLHVDVLYFSAADAHAEALKNLAELWNAVGQPERAAQALEIWRERYGPREAK